MGGAPYKPVEEGGGGSCFKCFHIAVCAATCK